MKTLSKNKEGGAGQRKKNQDCIGKNRVVSSNMMEGGE